MELKQVVHKSVIPLYAAAATWLLYALLFPLYKLPHFLLAATASAVVGIVARMFCRDTVEEVPEEPVSTGNQELDKMIADGKKAIVRPSGTEPKLKLYLTAPAPSASAAKPLLSALEQGCSALLKGPSDA